MLTTSRRLRILRGRPRFVAAAVTATLIGGLLAAVPVTPERASATGRPKLDLGPKVAGVMAAAAKPPALTATAHSVAPVQTVPVGLAAVAVDLPAFASDRHAATITTVQTDAAGKSAPASSVSNSWVAVPHSDLALAATQFGGRTTVKVSVVGGKTARGLGADGLAIQLQSIDSDSTTVGVRVPDSELAALYGANGAGRVRWTAVIPSRSGAQPSTAAVPVAHDAATHTTVLSPTITRNRVTTLAATTAPTDSAGTGSFAATPLKPSASWDVSAQTGSFAWSLPMTTPQPAAGPTPAVSLQYSSQSVDGETGSTNNQPSVVGDGWSLAAGGFIERSYVSCATDDGPTGAVTTSGDLCWGRDNASMSLQGHAGDLVKDTSTGTWKLEGDDGSRIQYLTGATNGSSDGGYWVVTTLDGTKYFFGRNATPSGGVAPNSAWTVPVFGNDPGEPGYNGDGTHAGTFASEAKTQVWRWNLDYVLDPHGNAESLTYAPETNQYRQDNATAVTYTRGGTLSRINYGLRDGTTTAASDSVAFTYVDRCNSTSACDPVANRANWPDTPQDQACADNTCTAKLSPTFWTTKALSTVTTSVNVGGTSTTVNQWGLDHTYPAPGDTTSAALWLQDVTHTGYGSGTSITTPTTTFSGVAMQNRVWATDGLAPLDKYRISSIATADGAVISVNYSAQECTTTDVAAITANPQSNTKRCYPQWWEPNVTPPQAAQQDLFHIYVVTSVVTDPHTGGAQDYTETDSYLYPSTPGWRYASLSLAPAKDRTWSDYVGYSHVEVQHGDPHTPAKETDTQYWFYQGLAGDRAAPSGGVRTPTPTVVAPDVASTNQPTDSRWLQGTALETKTFNGVNGPALSWTIDSPWASAATADNGIVTANMTGDGTTQTTAPLSTGKNRVATTVTTHDSTYGLTTSVSSTASDAGVADTQATCTTTSYDPNVSTTTYLVDYPSETKTVTGTCGAANPAGLDDTLDYYDSATTWPSKPTTGNLTRADQATAYNAAAAPTAWRTSSTVFDALGRATQATDPIGRVTQTAYTPATSGPVTQVVTTNAANWSTTTVIDAALGVPTKITDPNNHITTATYDALGRVTAVWLPDNPASANPQTPSRTYGYRLSNTDTNVVAESDYVTTGSVKTTFKLYDGLDRLIQTQAPADLLGGGATVSDLGYDATGQTYLQNNPYWAASFTPSNISDSPKPSLYIPAQQQIPSQVDTTYDGAGRPITSTLYSMNAVYATTSTAYLGADRVDVNPPAGTIPTTTYTDAHGLAAKLIQYQAANVSATAPTETTTYQHDARGNLTQQTDPAGHGWSWSYDALGRPTTAVDPDTGTTITAYDAADRPTTVTDAMNTVTSYGYETSGLGRKTSTWLGAVNTGTELASWAYNSTNAKGDLDSSSSYDNGLAYTKKYLSYDAADRATAQEWSIPAGPAGVMANPTAPDQYKTTTSYMLGGQPNQQQSPAEGGLPSETTYTGWDTYGNFDGLSLANSSTVLAGNYKYRGDGKLAAYEHDASNTDYTGYAYDPATNAVTTINDTVGTGSAAITVANQQITRDLSGNVSSVATTATNVATDTQCFTYDTLVQLTAAWTPTNGDCSTAPAATTTMGGPAPYWTSWTNDPATGNRTGTVQNAVTGGRTTTTTDTYTYAAPYSVHAVSQVSHATGTTTTADSYTYNKDGQTTTRPGLSSLTWTAGHLNNAVATAGTQHNIYDADGNLLLRTDPTQGTTMYLGTTELHVAPGSNTVDGTRTFDADGTTVANRTAPAGSGTSYLYWLVNDPNGTPIAQVWTKTGAITRRYQDPYGVARGAAVTWATNRTFLNAPTSTFSGLVHLGAREYSAATGSFVTADPIFDSKSPAQANGFNYAHNNPTTKSDPSGLRPEGDGGEKNPGNWGPPPAPPGARPPYYSNPKITPSVSVDVSTGGGAAIASSFAAWSAKTHWNPNGDTGGGGLYQSTHELSGWMDWCKANPSLCNPALESQFDTLFWQEAETGQVVGDGQLDIADDGAGDPVVRSLGDPESMVGATLEQVRAMMPDNAVEGSMKKGVGTKWNIGPKGNYGFVEFSESGSPGTDTPVHQGPYVKVMIGGLQYRAAADGAPLADGPPDAAVEIGKIDSAGRVDVSGRFSFPNEEAPVVEGGGGE